MRHGDRSHFLARVVDGASALTFLRARHGEVPSFVPPGVLAKAGREGALESNSGEAGSRRCSSRILSFGQLSAGDDVSRTGRSPPFGSFMSKAASAGDNAPVLGSGTLQSWLQWWRCSCYRQWHVQEWLCW